MLCIHGCRELICRPHPGYHLYTIAALMANRAKLKKNKSGPGLRPTCQGGS